MVTARMEKYVLRNLSVDGKWPAAVLCRVARAVRESCRRSDHDYEAVCLRGRSTCHVMQAISEAGLGAADQILGPSGFFGLKSNCGNGNITLLCAPSHRSTAHIPLDHRKFLHKCPRRIAALRGSASRARWARRGSRPRAPELKGQENIWQLMRQNWLSNRIFKSFDDIVDHYAWNTLIDQPWKIMSIARRGWAAVGHLSKLGILIAAHRASPSITQLRTSSLFTAWTMRG